MPICRVDSRRSARSRGSPACRRRRAASRSRSRARPSAQQLLGLRDVLRALRRRSCRSARRRARTGCRCRGRTCPGTGRHDAGPVERQGDRLAHALVRERLLVAAHRELAVRRGLQRDDRCSPGRSGSPGRPTRRSAGSRRPGPTGAPATWRPRPACSVTSSVAGLRLRAPVVAGSRTNVADCPPCRRVLVIFHGPVPGNVFVKSPRRSSPAR